MPDKTKMRDVWAGEAQTFWRSAKVYRETAAILGAQHPLILEALDDIALIARMTENPSMRERAEEFLACAASGKRAAV